MSWLSMDPGNLHRVHDRVQGKTRSVTDGEVVAIGDVAVTCLHTPCHTHGHVSYLARAAEDAAVFTGDILFVAG